MGDFMSYANNMQNNKILLAVRNILLVILGWICAIISLFIYPFIFGVAGVIMGILASKNQSKSGLPVIIGSILLMGVGLMFNGSVTHYAMRIFNYMR